MLKIVFCERYSASRRLFSPRPAASAVPLTLGLQHNWRRARIQKGKPLKKTKDTDAIFAHVQAVPEQARLDPATLEISVDTKAKVSLGEYSRGGKKPDGFRG